MAIALVQSKTVNSGAGTVTTLNLVLDSTPTNGNTIVLAVATNFPLFIAPTADIIWQSTGDLGASGAMLQLFVGRVITASASATITINGGAAGFAISAAAAEFSGLVRARIDKSVAATATSNAANSTNTGTAATAVHLEIGAICSRGTNGVTFSVPTLSGTNADNMYQTKTTLNTATDRSVSLAYRIASTAAPANYLATISASNVWEDRVVIIEDTPVGGGLRTAGHGGLAA